MHLLSDCRQNNNLTEGSGLLKAGWPVNKKTRGRKSVRWRRGKPNVGLNWKVVLGTEEVVVRRYERFVMPDRRFLKANGRKRER